MYEDMEKKELVIITNCTYPVPTATGVISLRFSDFLKEKYNIRIITLQEGNHVYNGEYISGNRVYSITNWRWKKAYIYKEKTTKSYGIKKKIYSFASCFLRVVGKVDSTFFHLDNRGFYEKKALNILKRLGEEEKIDVIISVSSPIEAHFAAKTYKEIHPEVVWLSYWGDLFSGSNYKLNIFYSHKRMCEMERQLLEKSDLVLTTPEIFRTYAGYNVQTKIKILPYTLKESILYEDNSTNLHENEKAKFVYMGSLNFKMRNPEFLLKLFIHPGIRGELHLFSDGCSDIVQKYTEMSNGRIIAHGKIGSEELYEELKKAHVLVNIGNSVSTSVPSKVLELMSYRKPILDIYYPGQESSVLSKYPICLRICMNECTEQAVDKINIFISEIENNNVVSLETMRNTFSEYFEEKERAILLNILE